jgi:hypothetical protein
MLIKLIVSLVLFQISTVDCDINAVSSSFNTLLGTSSINKYKELTSIAGKTYKFASKVVPYAETLATGIRTLLDVRIFL